MQPTTTPAPVIVVTQALDLTPTGQRDVLYVAGTVDGESISATGWVSALRYYYPPSAYCPGDGSHQLAPGSPPCASLHRWPLDLAPRPMTSQQRLAYFEQLLADAAAQPVSLL